MRQQSGVTLIELMITVAILGIILGVGIPAMNTTFVNGNADSYSRDLLRDISYARDYAINHSRGVSITPLNNSWSTGWQVLDGAQILLQTGSAAVPVSRPGEITSGTYSTAVPLQFDSQGRLASVAGQFVVNVPNCTGARIRTISLTFLGQVFVQEAQC